MPRSSPLITSITFIRVLTRFHLVMLLFFFPTPIMWHRDWSAEDVRERSVRRVAIVRVTRPRLRFIPHPFPERPSHRLFVTCSVDDRRHIIIPSPARNRRWLGDLTTKDTVPTVEIDARYFNRRTNKKITTHLRLAVAFIGSHRVSFVFGQILKIVISMYYIIHGTSCQNNNTIPSPRLCAQ